MWISDQSELTLDTGAPKRGDDRAQNGNWRYRIVAWALLLCVGLLTEHAHAASSPFVTPMVTKIGGFADGAWALDVNGNGSWDGCAAGEPDRCLTFGMAGDKPVVGRWNANDSQVSVGVYRPSTNEWFLDMNHNGAWDDETLDRKISGFRTVDAANIPVVGSWDGGATTKIGIFRNGTWYLDRDGNGQWSASLDTTGSFGSTGDLPVVGRWKAGATAHDTVGVFRAGTFYLDGDGDFNWDDCATDLCKSFGAAGDIAIAGSFIAPTGALTQVGTVTGTTWRFDGNTNYAFDGCTTDSCATGFGGSPQIPVVGQWMPLQWASMGEKDLLGAPAGFETASTVVPPGKNSSCPNGAAFLAPNEAGDGSVKVYRGDLSCVGMPNCFTAFDLKVGTGLASRDNPTNDTYISWTPTNELILTKQGLHCQGPDCTSAGFLFKSTNCGLNWTLKSYIKPSAPYSLGGKCGLRQRAINTLAVLRPTTGEVFVDMDGNNALDEAALNESALSAGQRFIRPGDQVVVGDWDGKDGTALGRFRAGEWVLDVNRNFIADCGPGADRCFTFGQAGDIPVAGRWNSTSPDLKHQIGVFRGGSWILDSNGSEFQDGTDTIIQFGQAGDTPVVGDWGNTGLFGRNTRVGVYRPAAGEWYLDQGSNGWQGCGTDNCIGSGVFAGATAYSAVIQEQPNYKDGIGVFTNGSWALDTDDSRHFTGCGPDQCVIYGVAGDIPLPGQWRSGPGGFDRLVSYSDPFNGMLYVSPSCDHRSDRDHPVFASFDNGTTWRGLALPQGAFAWGAQMTSVDQGKLYLSAFQTVPQTSPELRNLLLWPATVNKAAGTFVIHNPHVVDTAVQALRPSELPIWSNGVQLARVGRSGSTDVLLVSAPHVVPFSTGPGNPTEIIRARRVGVVTTAAGVSSVSATTQANIFADPGPTSSWPNATTTEAVMIEGPPGSATNLLYWQELTDSTNLDTTAVRTRGVVIRTSIATNTSKISEVINISRSTAGASAFRPGPYGISGHYFTAGAYATGAHSHFFTQWIRGRLGPGALQRGSVISVLNP